MTTDYYLDPDKVSELEPSEGDERQLTMLSPFAVPRMISMQIMNSCVASIRFEYSGEEPSVGPYSLDNIGGPFVAVRAGLLTDKVLELSFTPPAQADELSGVSKRLIERAKETMSKAKRLSYRMIAAILREWGVDVARKLIRLTEERQAHPP